MRPGATSRWPAGARRPVLVVAYADDAHQSPRQGPHEAPRHPSAAARRLLLPALASVACGNHQRGDRDQAGLGPWRTFIALKRAKAAVEHLQMTDRSPRHDLRI